MATAPSTQPPETAPATSPCSLTAIFAPGGRGADCRDPASRRSALELDVGELETMVDRGDDPSELIIVDNQRRSDEQ